jgi:hypothetical protein
LNTAQLAHTAHTVHAGHMARMHIAHTARTAPTVHLAHSTASTAHAAHTVHTAHTARTAHYRAHSACSAQGVAHGAYGPSVVVQAEHVHVQRTHGRAHTAHTARAPARLGACMYRVSMQHRAAPDEAEVMLSCTTLTERKNQPSSMCNSRRCATPHSGCATHLTSISERKRTRWRRA